MLPDYHVHLESDDEPPPCPYTVQRIETYVRHAQQAGVSEIGFAEHAHRFQEFREAMGVLVDEGAAQHPQVREWLVREFGERLDRYAGAVLEARRRGAPVRLGIEVDYLSGQEESLRRALSGIPWDYVIGSVHFLDGRCIDCGPDITWPEADVDATWRRYYQEMARAAASGLFDVISHPDLPKKFGHRPEEFPEEAFRSFLRAARAGGVAVEVNTAGLRKPAREIYPSREILRRVARAGLDVHLGSDAHEPSEVGAGFGEAVSWLRSAGVRRIVRWGGGRRRQYVTL